MKKAVASIKDLALAENEVSPKFMKEIQLNELQEIIIFIDGLFDKPERTPRVRKELAEAVEKTMRSFFPEVELIECFVRPFDVLQGFSSSTKS